MLVPGQHYSAAQALPHAQTMLLLDDICAYGPDWIEAALTIRTDSLLAEADGVPGWAGIEYMAQAIAGFAGIEQLQQGGTPKIGLLIGARRYESAVSVFTTGSRLLVRATLLLRDNTDLAAFDCTIHCEGALLATAQVKAYQPLDVRAYLEGASA